MDSPQSFTLFPNLPPELRDRIFLLSLPTQPRLIPYAATETPSLSRVNRESRQIFLSIYTKCFHTANQATMRILPYPISPYANLAVDTLFLFGDVRPSDRYPFPSMKWMTDEGRRGLKHLAVGLGLWISLRLHLSELEGLESLTFVMGMMHRYEKLRGLRHGGKIVEIDEKHIRWKVNKAWWRELSEGEREGWENLRVSLAEIVE